MIKEIVGKIWLNLTFKILILDLIILLLYSKKDKKSRRNFKLSSMYTQIDFNR